MQLIELIETEPTKFMNLVIVKHERLGEGVTRTICYFENYEKIEIARIIQIIWGNVTGGAATWRIGDTIVNNEIQEFLENLYQAKVAQEVIVVSNNY
jgi:hypothetical protein